MISNWHLDIQQCDICKRHKYDTTNYPGLLQPLVPDGVWVNVSLDFIEGLPKSKGKDVILAVVDRFSKSGHFIAIAHPYTVALCFLDNAFRLHGMPASMVMIDIPFSWGFFCKSYLHCRQEILLHKFAACHSKTDGQTKFLKRTLETYLRCFCSDSPHTWASELSFVEWWYNITYRSTLRCTPYEVVWWDGW